MNSPLRLFSIIALGLLSVDSCFAGEVLFYKASRNYNDDGTLGKVMKRELETRLFTHPSWSQRLYGSSHDPDVNEALEVYTKPDHSVWLSHKYADPSLSRIIFERIDLREDFDLKKRLDAVRISEHEIELPQDVAEEIRLLWRTMLPGLPKAPRPSVLRAHLPIIIGFSRENNSVTAGSIAAAAYDTPIYDAFLGVVKDLRDLCIRRAAVNDPAFPQLSMRIRQVRSRL